jgi:Uma2 family endonuclease
MAERALRPFYEHGFDIRCQMPLALGLDSEPEPDVAVVSGKPEDYLASHPRTAVLVVEVADSSLIHDRKRKVRLYAHAGIPDYWLTNLVDWRLEVYRDPSHGVYQTCTVLRPGDSIAPVAKPDLKIPVSDLLPFSGK